MELEGLNFLDYQDQLQLKTEQGKRYIYDPIRRKYLVLQPEELVRQLIVQYLILEKGYSANRISIELGLKVNDMQKRCDILIYNEAVKPLFIVEFKAPSVAMTDAVFKQIATYNIPLKVPYLLVSNGIVSYCCKIIHEEARFEFLFEIPDYSTISK